jgi:PAS domain S-box-containing protein
VNKAILKERLPSVPATLATLGHAEIHRLIEVLPAGAYTCDAQGLITYYNRHALALWGRAPKLHDPVDRFCGSFRLFGVDGTPIPHDACWMALALRDRREYLGHEIVIERPDGNRVTALAYASPYLDEAGCLSGAVNVLVDVSDRARAFEAQARLAAIVDSSDDAIIGKTLDGLITSWNAGAERLFGHTAEEAIGQPIMLIIPPERTDEERSIIDRLRRGERIDHYETVRVTKSGRRIEISLTSSPIRDATGRVIGASKVARDITSRKESERALVELKDELASQLNDLKRLQELSVMLSTAREMQPILDGTLRAAAAIEGGEMGLLSLCRAETDQVEVGASLGIERTLAEALKAIPVGTGGPVSGSKPHGRVVVEDTELDPAFLGFRELAREARFRAVHDTPLVTRGGTALGTLSIYFRHPHRPSEREMNLIDLCARQAADSIENTRLIGELREADRRKEEFLAILAHELRNPLAPIRNALELQRRDPQNPDTISRARALMERQVEHIVRLVDDLMDVSRISRNKLVLRKEEAELSAIVQSAVESIRPQLKGHTLTTQLPHPPVYLDADRTRLVQVFANLLNNAVKYSPQGGPISLSAERKGQEVVITVSDAGIGIEADMLTRVFEMFRQVEHALEFTQGGLGIGLSLVRGIVHLHGGSIEARSEGLGKGSQFTVRMPVLLGWKPESVSISSHQEDRPTVGGCRILVVEDNVDSATSLGMMLEMMGNEVRLAHDGLVALHTAAKFRPHLVLTDIGLPRLNGYDVARAIRKEPWGRSMFLCAITGWGQEEDKRRAAEAGFNLHIVKPVIPGELDTLIRGLRINHPPTGGGDIQ